MTRRDFVKQCALTTGAMFTLPYLPSCGTRSGRKPNVLFLFADDQSHEALSAFGSEVHTPNLDRLVRNGVSFTQAYNQGAWHGAVCVASRTMLVTGMFLWKARALEPTLDQEVAAGRLWPQYLERAGYDTYMSGKWHVNTAAAGVFGTTRNIRPGMPNQTKEGYDRPRSVEDYEAGWKPWDKKYEGHWKGGRHWSEVLADDAISFLQQAGQTSHPFFMYLAFNAPHDPRQSPKKYVDRYPLVQVRVPDNYLPEYPYKDAIGCGPDLRDERLAPFPRSEYAVRVHRREYYAIISHMDAQIGRILDALEASGKADETYIFFTADHGLAVGHHGLMGKQNMFEHSMRPPLIVTGPDIPKKRRIASPVYLQDIMPTTLELVGVEVPGHVQFKSLMPLIAGTSAESYEAIYGGYKTLQRMVRKGDFKLIYYPKIDKTLLFNLKNDPDEMIDLAGSDEYAPTIEDLKAELRRLQAEVGDEMVIE